MTPPMPAGADRGYTSIEPFSSYLHTYLGMYLTKYLVRSKALNNQPLPIERHHLDSTLGTCKELMLIDLCLIIAKLTTPGSSCL